MEVSENEYRRNPGKALRERPYTGILRHGNCEVSGGVLGRCGPLFRASTFRASSIARASA